MKKNLIIFLFAWFAPAVVSVAATSRPAVAVAQKDCVTSDCHANVKGFKVLHGPTASDACDACHHLSDARQHTFTLRASGTDLCTYCHEFSVQGLAVVHKPVQKGECLGCHNPHGGNTRAIVREKSMKDLCNRCHESITDHKAFLHAPVAQGECDSCHPPHASRFPKLLDVTGTDLCLACHSDFEQRMSAAKFRHKALKEKEGCEKCHDVHGGKAAMSLREAAPALCLGCHEKLKDQMKLATVPHSASTADRACLNCHDAHFSAQEKLQPKQTVALCMNCHDTPIKTDRRTVAATVEVVDPRLHKHGQIKEGQCAGCHDVHGGARAMLLRNNLSKTYYQRFSADNFALCFGCHDRRLLEQEKTTTLTAFRNGEVNLHFLHANHDERDKGCGVCHYVHASPSERLIRANLLYGIWPMPMRFDKTATGGSCFPGCHRQLAYDREHPIAPTTAPTTQQSTPLPRAQRQEERIVKWSASDRNGSILTIPDGKLPALLLLVNSDSGVTQTLKQLAEAMPKEIATQVVVIVSGQHAEQLVTPIESISSWPIVMDETLGASSALDVHGWPTLLVLRSDGTEVARLSGQPDALALKLPPYLQLAAGLIGAAEANRQVARQNALEDQAKESARALRSATAMLQLHDNAAALRTLDDAIKSDPMSIALKAARADALLNLGKYQESLNVLNAIPSESLPAAQNSLLHGEIAVGQQHWDQAREYVEAGLKVEPENPKLHFLMGQICEHSNDWSEASKHYRAASELDR